jgi:hypothetical protein
MGEGKRRVWREYCGMRSWRRWVPWVLVVLAAVIGLVSALNIWVKRQALDTDNWTNASGQLLESPEVRSALSIYLVDQLYENVDVTAKLEQRLPPQADPIAAPLAGAIRQGLVNAGDAFFARPRVQQLWKDANRKAHKAFIALIDNKRDLLQQTDGNVVLNLQPLVEQMAARGGLAGKLAEQVPPDAGQLVIMKGDQLGTARKGVKVIRVLSYFLFFLVLALYALAVFLARGRRRSVLMGVGVSLAVVGLIVLVVRRLAGQYLVDALSTNSLDKGAIDVVWAVETALLRNVGINALVYGIVVMFAAWVAGPARPARWLRRVTLRDHPWVGFAAVAVVLLIVLLAGPTDAQRIYPLLIVFAVALVGTEVLRRQAVREFGPPARAVEGERPAPAP